MMDRDLTRTTLESFLRSIGSLRRTDLRPMLDQIKVPAMGIYGDRDIIVHPETMAADAKGNRSRADRAASVCGAFPYAGGTSAIR